MMKCSKNLKKMGLTLAGLGLALSGGIAMAQPGNALMQTDGGFRFCDPECSAYWFGIGGRLNFDETLFSGDYRDKGNDFPNGGNIRRAYLKFMGGVGDHIAYNLTLNFAGVGTGDLANVVPGVPLTTGSNTSVLIGSGQHVNIEDAWINYDGLWECSNIRFGQFTPLATIDGWGPYGTRNDNMLLEPALETLAFSVPGKGLGLWVDSAFCDMFTVAAVIYHPQQNPSAFISPATPSPNNYFDPHRSDRLGGAVRFTFSPVHDECTTYHLGVLGRYQSMNHIDRSGFLVAQRNLFRTTPEAQARYTNTLVNTGDLLARSYNLVSVDALGIWGPFTAEAEWTQATVQRFPRITQALDVGNVRFHGWHAQAGYMFTGESRRYCFQTGTLHNPKPCGPWGAWEIVARYSTVNMVNKNVYGGSEHNGSVGLNWFINDQVKIAANYIRASIHQTNQALPGTPPAPTPVKRELNIFAMRFQVVF